MQIYRSKNRYNNYNSKTIRIKFHKNATRNRRNCRKQAQSRQGVAQVEDRIQKFDGDTDSLGM